MPSSCAVGGRGEAEVEALFRSLDRLEERGVVRCGCEVDDVVSVGAPDIELLDERTKEIYLCVDKILVEIPETKMCPITNVHILPDDEALLARMKEQLRSCNSWYKHIFSWKTGCWKIPKV